MKILLASADLVSDRNSWSGTPYQVHKSLIDAGHEVVTLTGLSTTRNPWHLMMRVLLGKNRYLLWMTKPALKKMGRRLVAAQRKHSPDITVGIGAHFFAATASSDPFVLFSDAPWAAFRLRYKPFEPAFPVRSKWYERLEQRAVMRSVGAIYTSQWAAEQCSDLYGLSRRYIEVVPLGANWLPPSEPVVEAPVSKAARFLFVGRDWQRKGGDIAISIVQNLHRHGVSASLDIFGVDAHGALRDPNFPLPGVTFHGRTAVGRNTDLQRAFESCHFVLVPTRAECFGIIFAEAAAFGKVAIAYDVDAVGEVILRDLTGLLFDLDQPLSEVASQIESLIKDPVRYVSMANAARQRHLEELNWAAFGRSFSSALTRLTSLDR